MADKCEACQKVIADMNNKAPQGYLPFGYGSSTEDPLHYYVFPEDDADKDGEVAVTAMCKVPDPIARS